MESNSVNTIRHENWQCNVLPLPRGYYGASGVGLFRGQPVGTVESAGNRVIGCRWVGGNPVKVEAGRSESVRFHGARGEQIVGVRSTRRKTEACVWQPAGDDTLTLTSLHRRGFIESIAIGCDEGWQAGSAMNDHKRIAMLWQGSGATAVELSDPAGDSARAVAIHRGVVVGSAGWPSRALLWPAGVREGVELHPPGVAWSEARGVGDGEQVGWIIWTQAQFAANSMTPVLWRSSSASMVTLLPRGFASGQAYDCRAGMQVGSVRSGDARTGFERAILWFGSDAELVDLHALVGGDWTDSAARSIHLQDDRLIVVGEARLMSPDRRGIAAKQIAVWEVARSTRDRL